MCYQTMAKPKETTDAVTWGDWWTDTSRHAAARVTRR